MVYSAYSLLDGLNSTAIARFFSLSNLANSIVGGVALAVLMVLAE